MAIRWWSILESSWINWTLFDRSETSLRAAEVDELTVEHPVASEAAELLGLRL